MSYHTNISRCVVTGAILIGFGLFGSRESLPADMEKVPAGLSASDWSSIRSEYERNRRAALHVGGEYRARNAAQQWMTHFDGRGFTVEPDGANWRWGLELLSYGLAGHERAVKGPARVKTEKERVTYTWDDTVEEWFVNGQRGLEHGFTLRQRPAGGGERLALRLAVRGELRPRAQEDGRGLSFVDGDGSALVQYAGLKVMDADGKNLPSRLQAAGDGFRLEMEESGARYPITIDPLAQQAYLKAFNTDPGDYFGESVAVSGDTIVIGAATESSNAKGVNGNQSDNSARYAGAAYVFVRSGGAWSQQAYLKASNTDSGDYFGHHVAVSGDTIVVGAAGESSTARGVNDNQGDNSAFFAGAAYVFVRNAGTWSQQAYLKASNTGAGHGFGSSVSVSGDTIVVGAAAESSNARGVNGNQSDNSALFAGAAYVFVRSGAAWSQQAYLKASNTDVGDQFGSSVAVSGDTAVVGAYAEASNATGVNGDQADNSAELAGAAYVFVRSGTTWSQQAYAKASNTDAFHQFGRSVAASGDTIVVSSPNEDSYTGAAYVFVRNSGTWNQQAYLKASNAEEGDEFGSSVAATGDTIVIGARGESSAATGVNGDQSDNSVPVAGAAYVFVRRGNEWSQEAYLKASNTGEIPGEDVQNGDQFGYSVAASGDTIVVGAPVESSNTTGVNGDQSDNSLYAAGAAYVFSIVAGNQPPIAAAGLDQTLECTTPNNNNVTLDGRGSFDPDSDPLTFQWSDYSGMLSMADMFSLTLPRGRHPFTLRVADGNGNRATDSVIVTVADTTRPRVTVQMTPQVLSPPDHGLVEIAANLRITDACDWKPTVQLVSISSNEADSGLEAEDLPNDIQDAAIGTDDRTFLLRAERSTTGGGREYIITYDVTDRAGNTTRLSGEVRVPLNNPN